MSDLQCPARILVCRHGEAAYSRSDALTEEGGVLTDLGRRQADALGMRVAQEHVAAVYTSTLGRARETGERVGSLLGLVPSSVEGVQEFGIGHFVDRHRGETIVLVSHGGVMSLALTHHAVNASPTLVHQHLLPNCAVVTVEVDADGWRLVGPWPGVAVGD